VTTGWKWRRSLQDVRNKRSADIGSDHHLVVAKFKMKTQAYKRTGQLRKRYDISKLKYDANVRESFKTEMKNRFQALPDTENVGGEPIEEKWRKIRIAFTEASDSVLGFKEEIKKTGRLIRLGKRLGNERMLGGYERM
jgi:hypothetical protein